MSTLHTQYSSGQAPASAGASGASMDPASGDAGAAGINGSSATREAVAAAAAAAAAAAIIPGTEYARSYSTMAPPGQGQMAAPAHQHAAQATQHHSLPSIDMNGHAAAVAGYQSSYGLADGTGAGGGMVGLMGSPTATSWGTAGPASPLASQSSAMAAANAAALAAGQPHQGPNAWYSSVYQHPQYSPAGHGMVMYSDNYATPSTAATAAYYQQQQRARLTTTLWEDEQTLVYQVDCRGICVARRHDDNMINGTKLLNVVGMSRGKRDGILKNEKGRRVVKVGPMHLKGVWIPFERARFLAEQFKVLDGLFPIFQPDPNTYLYGSMPINSPVGADPYSTTAATAGYSQLARAQDGYDGGAAATPAGSAGTAASSTVSHSHTASLSQVMAAHHQAPGAHAHHHSLSQGGQQQPQQPQAAAAAAAGLSIGYVGSPPQARLPGMPSSPTSGYASSNRYTPYGAGFQATGGSAKGAGSKRGSIDHHYSQMHVPMQAHSAMHSSASLASMAPKQQPQPPSHHHQQSQDAGLGASGADQDAGLTIAAAAASSQQPTMTSSYFDGLLAKSEQ
ncbi:hypothetical protein GGF46_000165 [Coemansia sp. RSA 552]|nr:hypothetical protein GGF46_000165 [Coemansia sp. RSA 552]